MSSAFSAQFFIRIQVRHPVPTVALPLKLDPLAAKKRRYMEVRRKGARNRILLTKCRVEWVSFKWRVGENTRKSLVCNLVVKALCWEAGVQVQTPS